MTYQLREEEKYICRIDRDQIIFWLTKFQGGDIEDEDCRRRIIDLLVNSVTVWDEPDGYKITTAYDFFGAALVFCPHHEGACTVFEGGLSAAQRGDGARGGIFPAPV